MARMSDKPPVNKVAARFGKETRQRSKARAAADRVPALTIVCHPDLTRVGERSLLLSVMLGQRVNVSRSGPDFQASATGPKRPLEDAYVSRKPLWLRSVEGGVSVDGSEAVDSSKVDGRALSGSVTVPDEQLERGVVLELAGRVGVLLHSVEPKPFETAHGLLGGSEALRGLYLDIERAAALPSSVVVLGESGSGKELVSRAVHERSARAKGPFVSVNLATLPAATAAAELFGYAKGAFAGAREASPGLIRQAHLGSFFMDEVGEASSELQAPLLRVIETGELRPLGGSPVKVDVRWIVATDPDGKTSKASGTFKRPLWYRLAATEIHVPPLRERREDIARLWVSFVAQELGGPEKLRELGGLPLVSAELMSTIIGHFWPGNVRELRHAAIRFALEFLRDGPAAAAAALSARLSAGPLDLRGSAQPTAVESREPRLLSREPLENVDDATLTAALGDNRWKIAATAKQLGISRDSLFRLIEQCEGLRKAKDLEIVEVMEALERCGHDVERMAASLQVSERALRSRMKELGVS